MSLLLDFGGQKYARRPSDTHFFHLANSYSRHKNSPAAFAQDQMPGQMSQYGRSTLAQVGCPELSQQISYVCSQPPELSMSGSPCKPKRISSAFNRRAREGFIYWFEEKPKKPSFRKLFLIILIPFIVFIFSILS